MRTPGTQKAAREGSDDASYLFTDEPERRGRKVRFTPMVRADLLYDVGEEGEIQGIERLGGKVDFDDLVAVIKHVRVGSEAEVRTQIARDLRDLNGETVLGMLTSAMKNGARTNGEIVSFIIEQIADAIAPGHRSGL